MGSKDFRAYQNSRDAAAALLLLGVVFVFLAWFTKLTGMAWLGGAVAFVGLGFALRAFLGRPG